MRTITTGIILLFASVGCGKQPTQEAEKTDRSLKSPNAFFVYRAITDKGEKPTKAQLTATMEVMRKRLSSAGYDKFDVLEHARGIELRLEAKSEEDAERAAYAAHAMGRIQFALMASKFDHGDLVDASEKQDGALVKDSEGAVMGRWLPAAKRVRDKDKLISRKQESEFLVALDLVVRGDDFKVIKRVKSEYDEPTIIFELTEKAGEKLKMMTRPPQPEVLPRRMAIIVDGRIEIAPPVDSSISTKVQLSFGKDGDADAIYKVVDQHRPLPLVLENISKTFIISHTRYSTSGAPF